MHFVHGLQDAVENHLADRIDLGHLGEDDVDAELLAFVAEGLGDVTPPADAAGIVNQDGRPGARLELQFAQQLLEAGAVGVLAGFDGVRVFSGDDQVAGLGQRQQVVALRLDRDRAAILRRATVQGGLSWHGSPV
ncbi:MAG: hypothetical protein OEL86_18785 [Sulfuritalea sp.]|nr:hypothetical protein [Sulfuritalea sp.]